ncbi:hypothetical protein V2W45_1343993 [Cenococcum geophilum]
MAKNYLMLAQPGIAIFAVIGILVIFIFSSALWWDTTVTAAEVLAVFGLHFVLVVFVLGIKLFKGTLKE